MPKRIKVAHKSYAAKVVSMNKKRLSLKSGTKVTKVSSNGSKHR